MCYAKNRIEELNLTAIVKW